MAWDGGSTTSSSLALLADIYYHMRFDHPSEPPFYLYYIGMGKSAGDAFFAASSLGSELRAYRLERKGAD